MLESDINIYESRYVKSLKVENSQCTMITKYLYKIKIK